MLQGASLNTVDRQGNNILQLALLHSKPSVAALIQNAGGSLNEQSAMPTTTDWSRAEEGSDNAKKFEISAEDLAAIKATWYCFFFPVDRVTIVGILAIVPPSYILARKLILKCDFLSFFFSVFFLGGSTGLSWKMECIPTRSRRHSRNTV